jgi:tubulysin polyketide synthase-like protein
MTAAFLLTNLTSRGVVLTVAGEDIQVEAPSGELIPPDIEKIRSHKPELLRLLAAPSQWTDYSDAIAHAFANPSTREEIGPLWMTDPDGWDSLGPVLHGGLCSPPRRAIHIPGICDRCGSDEIKDYPIHDGRSLRRDCSQCGKFIEFPKWNPI